jgi:hypothetical protein
LKRRPAAEIFEGAAIALRLMLEGVDAVRGESCGN